jgi:hypothetical protein
VGWNGSVSWTDLSILFDSRIDAPRAAGKKIGSKGKMHLLSSQSIHGISIKLEKIQYSTNCFYHKL